MKAIKIEGQTPGGERTKLADVIPLKTPYIVQIFPVYGCNFKCNYCIHSVPKNQRGFITNEYFIDYELYKKCIDDLCRFPQKLKMLRFAGTGEPLMHNDIAKMVRYAKEKNVADSIDIVTNGSLLTEELTKELVEAGLSRIRISIQGLSSSKYASITGQNIDFQNLKDRINYFYKNKGNTEIYIKIIDCALEPGEEELFLNIFGDMCDVIAIEHLLPAVKHIDYESIYDIKDKNITQNGAILNEVEVCPQPFYFMQINPNGDVVPCCSMETAYVVGNAKDVDLNKLWNGDRYNLFREKQLLKQKNSYSTCRDCTQYKYAMFPEDILDDSTQKLLCFFKRKVRDNES